MITLSVSPWTLNSPLPLASARLFLIRSVRSAIDVDVEAHAEIRRLLAGGDVGHPPPEVEQRPFRDRRSSCSAPTALPRHRSPRSRSTGPKSSTCPWTTGRRSSG